MDHLANNTAGLWAKRYYLASRELMEATLRPYDLGSTQWYVLWLLTHQGPRPQRDFLALLQVEKPTLSEIVSALVRKELVEQKAASGDQRQRLLALTDSGKRLWEILPNPLDLIVTTGFAGVSESDLATVVRVLKGATERLNQMTGEMKK
ncbi:MarR family winged helix-turn-helix transcriptional regulator [Leptospira kobayashii]|uniref:MarR family winged helix-turn-helix transcriptional regulator n=1 Tax=Leptospira kobayashii TaxID=1917830 RepID=UPI001C2C33DC|nr:MarR family winged helix-turn-helix transcriptional regulator [Leptospira kobayashii]